MALLSAIKGWGASPTQHVVGSVVAGLTQCSCAALLSMGQRAALSTSVQQPGAPAAEQPSSSGQSDPSSSHAGTFTTQQQPGQGDDTIDFGEKLC